MSDRTRRAASSALIVRAGAAATLIFTLTTPPVRTRGIFTGRGRLLCLQPMLAQQAGGMKKRVVVWGTGNVGRPAIRAVLGHRDLELAGVVVANPAKDGLDAGAIAGVGDTGVRATRE